MQHPKKSKEYIFGKTFFYSVQYWFRYRPCLSLTFHCDAVLYSQKFSIRHKTIILYIYCNHTDPGIDSSRCSTKLLGMELNGDLHSECHVHKAKFLTNRLAPINLGYLGGQGPLQSPPPPPTPYREALHMEGAVQIQAC